MIFIYDNKKGLALIAQAPFPLLFYLFTLNAFILG